jgi:hypothetical protein
METSTSFYHPGRISGNEHNRQFETGKLADCFFPFTHPIPRKGILSVNTPPDSDDILVSGIPLRYGDQIVGDADLLTNGSIYARINWEEIPKELQRFFSHGLADSISIAPNLVPARPAFDINAHRRMHGLKPTYTMMDEVPEEFFDRLRKVLKEELGLNTESDRVEDQVQLHISRALILVHNYVRDRLEKTDTHVRFGMSDVYVVWFCKTLQNWKALVSTTLPDGMYYEVTYDGDRKRTYIDAYKKFENVMIPDDPSPTDLQRMEQLIEEAKEMPNLKTVTREGFDDVGSGLSSGSPETFQERAKHWNPAGPDRHA